MSLIKTLDSVDPLCKEAIEYWGKNSQITKAIEEMSELITALVRRPAYRATDEDVAEEIADVLIMMKQLAMIFGEDLVTKQLFRKIGKLDERLEHYRLTKVS